MNYAGIIIGPELDYDFETKKLVIYKDRYKDKAGKNTIQDEEILKGYILNIYKTMLLRGVRGTYIYACNSNMQRYLAQFIPVYKKKEKTQQFTLVDHAGDNTIPLYDLQIAAGSFSDPQSVEQVKYLQLSEPLANKQNYFACKVVGESMNQIIPNGAICLFEKYSGGSRNGLITMVELTDYQDPDSGSNYTVKEYISKKSSDADGWKHTEITLKPRSNQAFDPIILRDEETRLLKVLGIFVKVLD